MQLGRSSKPSMLHIRTWNGKGVDTIVAALLMVVIVVVTSVIVYSWSIGILGSILPSPPPGRESLTIEYQGFDPANKNMTLYLRNTGNVQTPLISYYVNDLNGNQYAKTTWTGPTIAPTALGTAYIAINTACSGCKLIGSPFTYQPGNSYTVTVLTSRNNQFSFTILV